MSAKAKTKALKRALIEAMTKSLGIVTTACKIAGCDRSTYYKFYREDEEFKNEIDELENIALDFAESQLHKKIKDGCTTSTIFYLKTKGKKRGYIERTETKNVNEKPFIIEISESKNDK